MIFVVTGVHMRGFNRLVEAIDKLASKKIIDDVFIQTGFSTYEPKYCRWVKAIDFYQFEQYMDKADIVVTHGGAGCIAGALERHKPIVVVPRLKRYNEHANDHQLELTSVLEKDSRILAVYKIEDLEKVIKKAWKFSPRFPEGKNKIEGLVSDFLTDISLLKSKKN